MVRSRFVLLALLPVLAAAQAKVTSPKQFFGHDVGDDYYLSNYQQFSDYWRKLDKESDRMTVQVIGKTEEGRDQLMAIVTSPENQKKLARYREISKKLCLAKGLTDDEAKKLALEGKSVVWIDGGLHASEVLGAQQLIETCYQMVSRDDEEAKRIRNDVIILFVHANPDGMELISNWYMQEADPTKRNMRVPRLYQKYIGHDNNRDFYAVTQAETKNMNRIMYQEWFPQIMYNHHQTGPQGTVMFAPPFRDPFNHNIDAQVISGIDFVASAMMQRFLSLDMPGVTTKTGSSYSAWWNGGLRTTAYFHNMIGILTETIGSPTPMKIPFVANRRTPQGNLLYPIEPQDWRFRQSIEYSVQANMAVLDLASRYREKFLLDIYRTGHRQIERGLKDTWTDTPTRTAEARSMSDLRKPELRDAKAYLLPFDQHDPSVIWKLVEALIANGVKIEQIVQPFTYGGKMYPRGTFVIRTAQAFRPHVLDMMEAQDHPNDIPAPGAAPIPPYDSAGYTLALQMGVKFERVLDLGRLRTEAYVPRDASLASGSNGMWFGVPNWTDSYKDVFRILRTTGKAGLYKLEPGSQFGQFAFWDLDSKTENKAITHTFKLPRIALWDRYGGSMESGWTRWIMDQFGIPYKVVYPQELDAGQLNSKFDVIVFVDGAIPEELGPKRTPNTEGIPAVFQAWLGNINQETLPKLREFLENGGSIVTLGSSTSLAKLLGLPIESHLMEGGRPTPRTRYYVPGSILNVKVDNGQPVAWGMEDRANVMFDNSPVFKILDAAKVRPVAWFDSDKPLVSGWAWGQSYLKDGVAIAEAPVGKGKLYLFGPELLYRGQSWGTFRLFFNALLLSRAERVAP